MFVGFGMSSLLFIIHGLAIHGLKIQKSRMSLGHITWTALINILGAALYVTKAL
jgi:adiponectin receptor